MIVAYVHVRQNPPRRLHHAQIALEESIRHFGLEPFRFSAGKKLALFGDVLRSARGAVRGKAFVWCNSDVILTANPYEVPDPDKVYGFFRRDMPEGKVTHGVDMYYIPLSCWDDFLGRDIPGLYVGASYVDRWISRAMEKRGAYENLSGYIDHPTHPRSGAATDDANPYYQKNFRAYNAWAKRNGLEPIPAPPFLIPRLGHAWGLRDALLKFLARRK